METGESAERPAGNELYIYRTDEHLPQLRNRRTLFERQENFLSPVRRWECKLEVESWNVFMKGI